MKRMILLTGLVFLTTAVFSQTVKETYLYAVKEADSLFVDRHYDPSRMVEGETPAMIYMYGGGWAFGNRGGRFDYLTDIGVQVISIDYRKGLTEYGYGPAPDEVRARAIDMAFDDLTDAMVFVLEHASEWGIDKEKIMLSGSSAGGITTLMAIYDICNGGPYSRKFPKDWMPAGYIGYAGAIISAEEDLKWAKKPCPMLFFHGSADTSVAFDVSRKGGSNVFGPKYILAQLHEMEVPNWLYCEIDADHVLSYKPFSGYNTHEIQTFVEKFVVQGLQLEMKTEEYNLVESSHLPGFKPVHSKNPDAEGIENPTPPARR